MSTAYKFPNASVLAATLCEILDSLGKSSIPCPAYMHVSAVCTKTYIPLKIGFTERKLNYLA